ncbi:GAF domain-containing protein [Streptomyces xanthophaeus]
MNRFARLATRVLSVPLGLVWLEPAGEAAGALPECWPAETQPSPDVLECCQRVAESGRPQFRARAESGASAFAFAGVPLIGGSGEVLGVLAVMDPSPRVWSEDDVQDLSDLAAACSAQMRMRKALRERASGPGGRRGRRVCGRRGNAPHAEAAEPCRTAPAGVGGPRRHQRPGRCAPACRGPGQRGPQARPHRPGAAAAGQAPPRPQPRRR